MAVIRWDPFREMLSLQDRMNRLFQETAAGSGSVSRSGDESLLSGAFIPPVDVYEDDKSIVLKMEVPGIDQKDIDIRLENNVLSVQGERKFEQEEKQENFQRIERHYGSFNRSFTLPNTVDTDSVRADYENGVLKVKLAKRAEARPKQIKVNIDGQKQIAEKKTA
jgi:HSP20 family protein